MTIWNCFVCPPHVLTSLTPGIVRIWPLITHSWRSLSSSAFIGPESVYWNSSPNAVAGSPSCGCTPWRQLRRELLNALADELTRQIHRHRVGEHDRHHRQPELRQRSDFLLVRQAEHRALDRVGDELLDLGGRQARRLGDDDDLVVGQIGKRFDRNGVERVSADAEQRDNRDEDEPPVRERGVDDSIQHADPYSPSMVDRSRCDLSVKLPCTTTCSPALRPSSTGVLPSAVDPTRTGRTVKRSGAVRTKTMSCPLIC